MNFCPQVKRLLQAAGVKQIKQLADIVGVTESAISNWNAREKIPAKKLLFCSRKLNCSSDWIETGEGPMRKHSLAVINGKTDQAREGPWISSEQREILDLWEAADEQARDYAKIILTASVKKREEATPRQNHEGK